MRVLVLLSLLGLTAVGRGATLVRGGEPTATIVLAEAPTVAAREAATELQTWLRKATGAELPIVAETASPGGVLIQVGDGAAARAAGLDPEQFELEEVRLLGRGDTLILIGDDLRPNGRELRGTLWAVELFAEQVLGVRLLWPGELGEVVPRRTDLELPELDFRYVPPLRQRHIRDVGYNERVQRGLDYLKWSADEFKAHAAQSAAWFRFQRDGGSFRGSYGHAYGDYWDRFHEEHPDWFALQPDGTRDNSRADRGHRARLCVSNPGLAAQIAEDKIQQLRDNAQIDCVSISPNDGGAAAFCGCEACEAWDDPRGELISIWSPTGPREHVSLTDRFVRFYAAIGEQVKAVEPDRFLGAYAYSAYKLPPLSARLPDNVMIGLVDFGYLNEDHRERARESWQAWSAAASSLFLRPNLLMAGLGYPTVYVHRLGEDIKFCAENGMLVTDFDCCYQNWATDGLNYYVLARLLWDPTASVDALVDDYCQAGFGPAAPAVRGYFDRLERATDELAAARTFVSRRDNPEVLAAAYTDELLAELNAKLDQAKSLAAGDETVLARLEFLRGPLGYTRIRRDWDLAKAAGDKAKVKALESERDAWFQGQGISWALNAPYLRFYGY